MKIPFPWPSEISVKQNDYHMMDGDKYFGAEV